MSKQTESPSNQDISSLSLVPKKLYSEEVQAEMAELQSDIDILLQQLQNLSSQRLTAVGSVH
jgi:hypothetical protein